MISTFMKLRIHLISDLDYGFNEFSDPIDLELPEVDLIVLNGNLGVIKRSMLYAEAICKKYPTIPVIYNMGRLERYELSIPKSDEEVMDSVLTRLKLNPNTPQNLYVSNLPQQIQFNNGFTIDILTTFGFCKIHQTETDWENTTWYKKIVKGVYWATGKIEGLNTDDVAHGHIPVFATKDWVNESYEKELNMVRTWELSGGHKKLLITSINPIEDPLYKGITNSPYLIHLENGLWLSSGPKVNVSNFLGAHLVSNPGRGNLARQNVILFDL